MITIIIVLLIVGFLLYILNKYVPLQPPFGLIINFIVILFMILWILSKFGLVTPLHMDLR